MSLNKDLVHCVETVRIGRKVAGLGAGDFNFGSAAVAREHEWVGEAGHCTVSIRE
jgi:hypothetical protein